MDTSIFVQKLKAFVGTKLDQQSKADFMILINTWRNQPGREWIGNLSSVQSWFTAHKNTMEIVSFDPAVIQLAAGVEIGKAIITYRNGNTIVTEKDTIISMGQVKSFATICPACTATKKWFNTYCSNNWHSD